MKTADLLKLPARRVLAVALPNDGRDPGFQTRIITRSVVVTLPHVHPTEEAALAAGER